MTPSVRRFKKRQLATMVTMCALAALLAVANPEPSYASATGQAFWGVHVLHDIPIPSGKLVGKITSGGWPWSTGLYVKEVRADIVVAGRICNWNVSFDFYDSSNQMYAQWTQGVQERCSTVDWHQKTFDGFYGWKARPGRGCIRLYRDYGRERLASVCHAIVK